MLVLWLVITAFMIWIVWMIRKAYGEIRLRLRRRFVTRILKRRPNNVRRMPPVEVHKPRKPDVPEGDLFLEGFDLMGFIAMPHNPSSDSKPDGHEQKSETGQWQAWLDRRGDRKSHQTSRRQSARSRRKSRS